MNYPKRSAWAENDGCREWAPSLVSGPGHRAPLFRLRRWLAQRVCPECVWNSDMSAEIDRLTLENEQLGAEVAELHRRQDEVRHWGRDAA
jgi:hypothetical protein